MYSLALIIFVVSEKKAFEHFPIGYNVIYVLWWWPSWISDRHKKQKIGKGHSNDLSLASCCFSFQLDIQHGCQGQ
jgi:hypothetical protein